MLGNGACISRPKGAGATGGLYQSDFDDLLIVNFDNGIWLRGGATGAVEPHQFLNFRNVTVLRTAAGGGDSFRCTGQVNQVKRDNCLWQSASAATTRTGRSMYFGRDPLSLADASARYPQGNTGVLDSIQGADWLVDIESGQELVFSTPYCEKAKNGFRVRSVNITNPTDVLINNPRIASIATLAEVATTGGTICDVGDYCDVRWRGPGYFVTDTTTPWVIQNDSDGGAAQAINLSVEGMTVPNNKSQMFNVPASRRYLSNSGTRGIVTVYNWDHVRIRGRNAGGGIELGVIYSMHPVGASFTFVCYLSALYMKNTANIAATGVNDNPTGDGGLLLPGGVATYSFAVGEVGRATKVRIADGTTRWKIEKLAQR